MKKFFVVVLSILLLFTACDNEIDSKPIDNEVPESKPTVIITPIEGKKTIKGPLTGEELHLTKDNSPYVLIGNVLIQEGDTLIIDPGVELQVNGNYYIQVEGAIKVNGTESERIKIYGINEGTNNWDGINVINNNGSSISYSTITGLTNGIVGYCDIDHTEIKSNYYAIGKYVSYDEQPLKGVIKDCNIEGKVAIGASVLLDNTLYGTISVSSSNIDGNTITGSSLSTNGSLLINNKISSKKVTSYSDIIRYVTYDGCDITIGVRYSSTYPSAIYATQFNNCTFTELSSDVNNSNFNNCGVIKTTISRTVREKFDCTGNYWGDINTAEIKSKGDGKELSFITDYYDDFNKSRIDYSNYKETVISDIGYKEGYGRSGSTTTSYTIGDTGPAGGLIFYDKGYYSDGWRYLEVAPSDIGRYIFGYYRPEGEGLKEIGGTSTVIGSGEYNTKRLVKYMDIDGKAYYRENGDTTSEYAAKKCLDYTYGGKDDWFLPSINELDLMYENLHKKGLGAFVLYDYWSSSEYYYGYAWYQSFGNGKQFVNYRYYDINVRAIRAF